MSHFIDRLESGSEEDIFWKICVITTFCISPLIIFVYIRIIQYSCIPQSSQHHQIQPKKIKLYSFLCATFATLNAIVICTSSFVCAQWQCWNNTPLYMLGLLNLNTYGFAKCFLYLIFIGRLFNPYYSRIYEYSKKIQYSLWFLLIVLLMVQFAWNIDLGLLWSGIDFPYSVDDVIYAVYCITDIVLSSILMVLFFRPICSGNANNQNVYMTVAKRFGIISALQLITAVLAQSIWLGQIYLNAIDAPVIAWKARADIGAVITMLDCLLLEICIYVGFARWKKTVCFWARFLCEYVAQNLK